MADAKALLRSRDVAHLLDCSPDQVVQLARTNKIKAEKQGRLWRFRLRDVKAYMRKQKKE
jgi:excisionase family DNA binding protein